MNKSSKVSRNSVNEPSKCQVHSYYSSSVGKLCHCTVTFFLWLDNCNCLDSKSIEWFLSLGLKASTVWSLLEVMDGSDKQWTLKSVRNLAHKFEILTKNKLSVTNNTLTAERTITYWLKWVTFDLSILITNISSSFSQALSLI